jgi:hypothetical protein
MTRAVIVRLAGGLGNQMFQYAFGRALASRNEVPLILDAVSGFPRDPFRRSFSLSPYDIRCDYLPASRAYVSPVSRLRRRLLQAWSRQLPLAWRPYVMEPDAAHWDPAISSLRVAGRVCFEGYWQHEEYFRNIRDQLLEDLTPSQPLSAATRSIADRISERRAIAVHVRCLRHAAAGSSVNPRLEIETGYYERAIALIAERITNPVFFVFSDEPEWARQHVPCQQPCEYLRGGRSDYEDLWLMSRCQGFIIGNSTFSWWAAWLSRAQAGCVIAPSSWMLV